MSVNKFAYLKAIRVVPTSPYRVLVEILNYSDAQGCNSFPSVERLMDDCRMSRSTVHRNLKWLRDKGWIIQESRGGRSGDGHTWSSVYSLAYGIAPEAAPETISESVNLDAETPVEPPEVPAYTDPFSPVEEQPTVHTQVVTEPYSWAPIPKTYEHCAHCGEPVKGGAITYGPQVLCHPRCATAYEKQQNATESIPAQLDSLRDQDDALCTF